MRDRRQAFYRLWPVPALVLFGLLTWQFWFTQDDAFITYRYIANFLHGDGLVYNVGERVEGYTNFLWTIVLALIGSIRLDYLVVSKLIGLLCGAGTIVLGGLTARQLLRTESPVVPLLTSLLIAANGSVAYWSQAGLETGVFTLCMTAAVYWYVSRSPLLGWAVLMAALFRPEGLLLAGLLIPAAWMDKGRRAVSLSAVAIVTACYLPLLLFRLSYYSEWLPNPFYAKTSFDLRQVMAGIDYTGEFFFAYGLAGVPLLGCILLWRRLSAEMRAVLLLVVVWTLYVTFIGGDMLKVNRFYVPVAALYAVVTAFAVHQIPLPSEKTRELARTGLMVAIAGLTLLLPLQSTLRFLANERSLVEGMSRMGTGLAWIDNSDYSMAATTIGALGYRSNGHRLIDMLGLTDSTIAKHPEPEIPGITSTWRERNFNAAYLLDRSPEYIIFSTSAKPSAPAELALMLQPRFLRDYRIRTVPSIDAAGQVEGFMNVFRRVRVVSDSTDLPVSVEAVSAYKAGIEAMDRGEYEMALREFESARNSGGAFGSYPEFLYVYANCLRHLDRNVEAYQTLNNILAADSLVLGPHRDLYPIEMRLGDTTKAKIHRRYLEMFSPLEAMMLDSLMRQE